MAEPSQENSPAAQESYPVKRKRGRPRKDDSVRSKQATNSQALQVHRASSSITTLVGQQVSGVINGKFDAGYLLSVKVGSTGPILQGLVFEPSMYSQVTKEIDLAPSIPMSGGHETPLMVPKMNYGSVKASSLVAGNSGRASQRSRKSEPPNLQTSSSGFAQGGLQNDAPSSEPVKTSSETLPGQENSNNGHGESTKDATTKPQLVAAGSSTHHTTTNTEKILPESGSSGILIQQATLATSGEAASVAIEASEQSGQINNLDNSRSTSVLNNDIGSAEVPAPDAAAIPAPQNNDEMVVQNDKGLPTDNAK